MLTRCLIRASMAAAALLCATVGLAAERSATESVSYTLLRSGNSLGTHTSLDSCEIALKAQREIDSRTKTSGQARFVCRTDAAVTVMYGPAPTCAPPRSPIAQVVVCPTGTSGAYTQTKSWSAAPYPVCEIEGEWTPATPSARQCPPTDTDNDGVPDSADECPTVYATTPNGCPATPPTLMAPTIRAEGISTSAIRVTVLEAVAGAGAYSLERCIGATCTSFSQFLCVTGLTGTHSSLSASLTARYRARASRDTSCGTAAGNLGEYSAIVSGTTLTPTPVVGAANLSWTPPIANTDGSVLRDLAGYRISYGTSANALTQTTQVPIATAASHRIENLSPGTYYFALRSYTSGGNESVPSNVISLTIQ